MMSSMPTTLVAVDTDGDQSNPGLVAISCLVDDALSVEEANELLTDWQEDGEFERAWNGYHLIGEVLRGGDSLGCSAKATTHHGSLEFVRQVMTAVQATGSSMEPIGEPTVLIAENLPVDPVSLKSQVPAANDSVFRWKMVAGLATLAAVLSVAWGVGGPGSDQGAVLAKGPAFVVTASSDPGLQPVLVSTPQGTVLRDARLEELMQAHRQTGGASALQVPAGFLRSATFDASQR